MVAMGLVLGQSLMFISTTGIMLCKSISPLSCIGGCCLHLTYMVYKHFDRSLHVGSSETTCVQSFRSVPYTGFEILGFKLKNENNDEEKNWINELFAISPMLMVQFTPKFSVVSKVGYH